MGWNGMGWDENEWMDKLKGIYSITMVNVWVIQGLNMGPLFGSEEGKGSRNT